MIACIDKWRSILDSLMGHKEYSLDTETTGLEVYGEDRLFGLAIACKRGAYYFNFNTYQDIPSSFMLSRTILLTDAFQALFNQEDCIWYMHNAKFDLGMLAKEKALIKAPVHCTQAIARVEYNEHMIYSLDKCAQRIGEEKLDIVEDYISGNKLYEWQTIPGKKKRTKKKFFDRVPWDIMSKYALQDALVTLKLGRHQDMVIEGIGRTVSSKQKKLSNVQKNEIDLTRVCFEIEQIGIKVDIPYCLSAADHYTKLYNKAAQEFERTTGVEFVDSGKCLAPVFDNYAIEYPRTDKGQPSFVDKFLNTVDHPVAETVRQYRDAYKRANTYFRNIIYYADTNDVVHAEMKQAGTATGRFSYANPNLQNVHKEDTGPHNVRGAFVPRDGYVFVMIDYDQMEFRLMLDYAEQDDLIQAIINGHDPHTATAEKVGIDRKHAKTLNFGLLYGMGVNALSNSLKKSKEEAREFRDQYFEALPKVAKFIKTCSGRAERRGYIFNWLGRRYIFPDKRFSYKACNYLIQGGAADIVKKAMNKLHIYLKNTRSHMLIQIHDEVLFEVHESELHIIDELKQILENTHKYKTLPLTCSVSHSWKNWGDVTEGYPVLSQDGRETRDQIQEQDKTTSGQLAGHVVNKDKRASAPGGA